MTTLSLRIAFQSVFTSRVFPSRCIGLQRMRFLTTETKEAQAGSTETPSKTDKESSQKTEESEVEIKLKTENEKLENQVKELTDKYKRALAETENVRVRFRKQLDDSKLYAVQGFCKDLLEVADILGTATSSVPKEELDQNQHLKDLYEGLLMTETQLQKVFQKNKLFKIDPVDEKFDPNLHEAMFEVPTPDKEPGHVAVVTKIGYRLHDRTLRPALVGVAKAPS
ncbi:GrpE protein-like 1, mitochondrial [Holothuria leucospilota]|uniref:GrpE protein homolog n=1 Tax=Holothuria leucospilota TaxID=206669 RepID=A0A9Q0YRM2_HOLLE|nr:GrpE protein-like 1, mitochondrial [Holothuria leucospilota]